MTIDKNSAPKASFGAVFERGIFMKKAVGLIFAAFMLFSFALSVSAEEFNGADLFTVNLPDDFEQTGAAMTDFTFTNENGDTFAVSYSDNAEKDNIFSPADMSKKEIEEYNQALSEESKAVMKDYADDFDLKFISGEKVKQKNGKTALVSQSKTTITTNKKTSVYYQTIYEFGGIDYRYTFTYTTDDEAKKDSFNEVFESIDIFENETKTNSDKLAEYALFAGLGLLILVGIIRFIRTPEKRAQGKLK